MIERFPPSRRQAFVKSWVEHFFKDSDEFSRQMERLEHVGILPAVLAIMQGKDGLSIAMEEVNGFDLSFISPEYEKLKFSTHFAQSLARVFLGLHKLGLYQWDLNPGNFMYDLEKQACVVVDPDAIDFRPGQGVKRYIYDFSYLQAEIYLGSFPEGEIRILEGEGRLAEYMPKTFSQFLKKQKQREEMRNENEIIRAFCAEPLDLLMREQNVNLKVHPGVYDFMVQGLNPKTIPSSFDALFQISD